MAIPYLDLKIQYKILKKDIDASIQKVLDHGAFIMGPEVGELEKAMNEYVGSKHSLAIASGTDALLVAMMALGIGRGDEVITTSFSFFATAEVIALLGATPVFVDIDPETYNLDARLVEKAITPKTKAIVPVSLYGQPADMDQLNKIASQTNIPVIEDAAQSFGATYKGKTSCNLSTIGCTSFFPAKPLGCYGDGGAVFTNDEQLHKIMDAVRVHGQEGRYHHTRIGINGRLDSIQCAVLLAKMGRYKQEVKMRQDIAERYNAAFKPFHEKIRVPLVKEDRTSVWAQYTLAPENRTQFQSALTELGIPTSVHYPKPMHLQPALKGTVELRHSLKWSEWAADRVISLPLYADMPSEHVDQVIEAVTKVAKSL